MGLSLLHANDNVLMQNGLHAILSGGGISRIDAAFSFEEAIQHLKSDNYDLVVIDPLSGPGFSIDKFAELVDLFSAIPFLIISEVDQLDLTVRILEKDIDGFLTRECDEDEIKHAVFSVSRGEKFYCNKVLDIALNKPLDKSAENCEPTVLTTRESEITRLVAIGKTNKEIAEILHLSPHTVHTHRKNILKKLNINSASELALYAIKAGIISD